jgi:aminoglycoside phosphotransferase (APT) family kinase protein
MGELSLPDELLTWIEETTGGRVTSSDRIPGGASREAWFVDVSDQPPLFLRYSAQPMPERSAFHRLAVEAEIVTALHDAGVRVPHVLAVHPTREAVLSERERGATWFYRIQDPDEQVQVAQDFIAHLAQVHSIDPRDLHLPSLGPVMSARDHALERIAGIRSRGTAPDGSIDPLLRFTCDWLERNVPDYDGPVVLVQGDTGPGNFLYENGKVVTVVDWELAHFGDPMDDIAWLTLRAVQDTFTDVAARLREYEDLSGHAIDPDRIWYYRLFAEATMTTLRPNEGQSAVEAASAGRPVERDIGNGIIYGQLHRRLWLEALTKAMGVELPRPALPAAPAPAEWHHYYDQVLGSLQTIVPRISDPLASQWSKGLARVVKYLKEIDLAGRDCDDVERGEIAALLGTPVDQLDAARTELARAVADRRVSDDDYVRYLWNKVLRDDHLMRTASGALHDRTWPELP